MKEKDLIKLETIIISKINKVKNCEISPEDSGVGKDLNLMRRLDESTYDDLLEKYKIAFNEYKNSTGV